MIKSSLLPNPRLRFIYFFLHQPFPILHSLQDGSILLYLCPILKFESFVLLKIPILLLILYLNMHVFPISPAAWSRPFYLNVQDCNRIGLNSCKSNKHHRLYHT